MHAKRAQSARRGWWWRRQRVECIGRLKQAPHPTGEAPTARSNRGVRLRYERTWREHGAKCSVVRADVPALLIKAGLIVVVRDEVDYLDALGGSVRRLTHLSPEWADLVEPEEISYRSWDGLYIQGFLYRPPAFDPTGSYPTLVQVHGGGTNSYLHSLNTTEQLLAQRGYVVLAVNYRGGSGFGRSFQELGVRDWANGQARDAAAAADFVRAQPWSNGRVGVYGYSYGGITSMAAIARVPDAFDAAVPMAGIYDFGDAYTNADRLGKIFIRTGHGGSPDDVPDIYAISNTLARVENITTPVPCSCASSASAMVDRIK